MQITSLFTPEAIATYITGFASALVLIGLYWVVFIRKRPSRVLVEQTLETTLVSTPKDLDLTDAEPITLLYGENPVDMLWMTELRVRNLGRDVISRVHLRVQVDNETRLLGADLANLPPGTQWDSDTYYQIHGNTLGIALSYLNPFHEHKQETTIKVLCNRKPQIPLTIKGGGKGWSVAFVSSTMKENVQRKASIIFLLSTAMALGSLGYAVASEPPKKGILILGFVLLACSIIAEPILERWLTGRLR